MNSQLYKVVNSRIAYKNGHLACHVDTLEKGGKQWEQAFVSKPYPDLDVGVIPFDQKRNVVYMVNQFRHANNRFFWQFPGGAGEEGATLESIAYRELAEETGIIAKRIHPIGVIIGDPGLVRVRATFFVATDLFIGDQALEDSEFITKAHEFTLDEIDTMIDRGEIQCGYALAGWTLFTHYLRKVIQP